MAKLPTPVLTATPGDLDKKGKVILSWSVSQSEAEYMDATSYIVERSPDKTFERGTGNVEQFFCSYTDIILRSIPDKKTFFRVIGRNRPFKIKSDPSNVVAI